MPKKKKAKKAKKAKILKKTKISKIKTKVKPGIKTSEKKTDTVTRMYLSDLLRLQWPYCSFPLYCFSELQTQQQCFVAHTYLNIVSFFL